MNRPQNYPRIDDDEDRYAGFLAEDALVPHTIKIDPEKFREIIENAIAYAGSKSSRAILEIPDEVSQEDADKIFLKAGSALFTYFVKYCGDPASTAFDCLGRHYSDVAREQFHNRTLQKERMNSGWRYQYMAKDMSIESKRFVSVSDIGAAEADFNAVINLQDKQKKPLSIYVSIKNRANTMGGQDWPKAIRALEAVASTDKNRGGPYICVFGIAMDRGTRLIKFEQKTGEPYSNNTEIWLSDFFWPFFTNYSYMEVIEAVLGTLEAMGKKGARIDAADVPETLIDSFGVACRALNLVDDEGNFNDAYRLANLFVLGISKFKKNDKK